MCIFFLLASKQRQAVFMSPRWNATPTAAGGAVEHRSRSIVSNVGASTDPTKSFQSDRASPRRGSVLHDGRDTAAPRAGQRAAGGRCRANLPTCGEDYSGVPGRSGPLQKRGYPAEKAPGTAVRVESRSNLKQNRCVTEVGLNLWSPLATVLNLPGVI